MLDKLEGPEKITALILGVISGNMFDWGAKAVATLMETTDFGFAEAEAKIPGKRNVFVFQIDALRMDSADNIDTFISLSSGRPWLQDDLDDWINRLEKELPHKCAAIFVDNSGVDIVLGILPFARDLLQRGTKVTIGSSNEVCRINDSH